MVGSALAVLLT